MKARNTPFRGCMEGGTAANTGKPDDLLSGTKGKHRTALPRAALRTGSEKSRDGRIFNPFP